MSSSSETRRWAIAAALVLLSGAGSLILEVVWARRLTLFLGVSAYAHATVLSAFMLGLALGSWRLGAWSDRFSRPLLLFGLLEGAIGVYAAASGWLLDRIEELAIEIAARLGPEWAALHALASGPSTEPAPWGALALDHGLRFALALLVVALPAALMGGSLPVLLRSLASADSEPGPQGRIPGLLAGLYGANTFGAACGAVAAGYWLLAALGVQGSTLVGSSLHLAVGVSALALARFGRAPTRPPCPARHQPTPDSGPRAPFLVAFGLTGFCALALQVLWTRALILVIGSSVYAFSLVLGVYLLGTSAGSLWASSRDWSGDRDQTLRRASRLQVAVAFALVLGLFALSPLPRWFVLAHRSGVTDSFPLLQVLLLALCATLLLVPTSLLGALYPTLAALATGDTSSLAVRPKLGSRVGGALAANSAGTILGAPLAAAILLPGLGIARSLVLAGALHFGLGYWLARLRTGSQDPESGRENRRRQRHRWLLLAAILCLLALVAPFDQTTMTSGPYVNAFRLVEGLDSRDFSSWLSDRNRLLYYHEGADATVTVREDGDERLLVINGKTDGSRFGDRRTQVAIAALPLIAHPAPRRALVVGLGTGISAATLGLDPNLEHLDVVEISSGVIAASAFFDEDNRGILFDPRVRLLHADARRLLLVQRAAASAGREGAAERYDLIVSEPSNPWISGVSSLFTFEFFALAADRLAADGVYAQWFQGYGMSSRDLRIALATFRAVLPEVTVWLADTGDYLFLGSRQPVQLRLGRLEQLRQSPVAREVLAEVELDRLSGIARTFLLGSREAARYSARAPLNTDDRPRVELSSPRQLYRETTLPNLIDMVLSLDGQSRSLPLAGLLQRRDEGIAGLGLAIGTATEAQATASWRILWRALAQADPRRQPEVVVLQERSLEVAAEGGLEVLIAPAQGARTGAEGEPPLADDVAQIRGWLGSISSSPVTDSAAIELADGTPAVWFLAAGDRGPTLALAFSCPAPASLDDSPFRYAVRRQVEPAQSARELAVRIAALLRCARPA